MTPGITQINIHIDKDVDPEETKVKLNLTQVKLQDALELMMLNTGLAYTFTPATMDST